MKKTKRLVSILCAMVMVLAFAAPVGAAVESSVPATEEAAVELQFSDALEAYISKMDLVYISADTHSISTFSESHLDGFMSSRKAHIQSWADEMELTIIDQETSVTVEEVLSNTDTQAKVKAYVWTTLSYVNDGEEENTYTMGFGTDHIFTIDKTADGGQTVSADSFIDNATFYEGGYEEDLQLLMTEEGLDCMECGSMECLSANTEDADGAQAVSSSYNAADAISYSETWCGQTVSGKSGSQDPTKYNPIYYYYKNADCANFVSQCLDAGGMTQGGNWKVISYNTSGTPEADTNYTKTKVAWRSTSSMSGYFEGLGYNIIKVTDPKTQIVAGNPFYYNYDKEVDGKTELRYHIMLAVGVNSTGKIIYNAHNDDAYNCLFDLTKHSNRTYTIELLHNPPKGYTSTDLYGHNAPCNACGEVVFVSSHTWRYSTPYYICTVCGYRATSIPGVLRTTETE